MKNLSDAGLNVNEYVSYRHNGIYKISDICSREFGTEGMRQYYVLESVYDQNAKIYVPADTENLPDNMKRVLTQDEISSIINGANKKECTWIEDNTERENKFNKILESGDRKNILWLLKTISLQKEKMSAQKKKLYSCDEKTLSLAERIISEEFAFVLGIKRDEVIPYIIRRYA